MEYLTFAPNGQWTLCKAIVEPKDADKPGNKQVKTYTNTNLEGKLPVDHGDKGMLHDFSGGKRPKPKGVKDADTWGKPHHLVDSVYVSQNPGSGT